MCIVLYLNEIKTKVGYNSEYKLSKYLFGVCNIVLYYNSRHKFL